ARARIGNGLGTDHFLLSACSQGLAHGWYGSNRYYNSYGFRSLLVAHLTGRGGASTLYPPQESIAEDPSVPECSRSGYSPIIEWFARLRTPNPSAPERRASVPDLCLIRAWDTSSGMQATLLRVEKCPMPY